MDARCAGEEAPGAENVNARQALRERKEALMSTRSQQGIWAFWPRTAWILDQQSIVPNGGSPARSQASQVPLTLTQWSGSTSTLVGPVREKKKGTREATAAARSFLLPPAIASGTATARDEDPSSIACSRVLQLLTNKMTATSIGAMYIRVKRNKTTYFIQCDPTETTLNIKQKLHSLIDQPPSNQRLILFAKNDVLDDSKTLANQKVENDAIVALTLRKDDNQFEDVFIARPEDFMSPS